jgi:hypothetical protein
MRIPTLTNARNVIQSWQSDDTVAPEVRYIGYGPELDVTAVSELVRELTKLTAMLVPNDEGRRVFDQRAAKLLAERLRLPSSVAAEKGFWQWFAITQADRIVRWRWIRGNREAVSPERWLGGWKDTFRRLWLRANVVCDTSSRDPFELAGYGDEDFWVGIIERDIAGCRTLVRTLVRCFFMAAGGEKAETKRRMLHYRATIKRIRQIRPSRVYEEMTPDEVEVLVRDTMSAVVPLAAAAENLSSNQLTRKKSKRKARQVS